MKTRFLSMLAGLAMVLTAAVASAQSPYGTPTSPYVYPWDVPVAAAVAPTASVLTDDGLEQILKDLGYAVERSQLPNGGPSYFAITLSHPDQARTHVVAIDHVTKTVVIVGGGFASQPAIERADTTWMTRLLRANNAMAPSYIFMNDSNVFGLGTIFGASDVNTEFVKQKIAEHVSRFDTVLSPLVDELAPPSGLASY